MGTTITSASAQWMSRPDDERFWGINDLIAFLKNRKVNSESTKVSPDKIRAVANENTVTIQGPNGANAFPTNWALKQMATRLGIGTDIFEKVSPEIAEDIINYRLEQMDPEKEIDLLIQNDPDGLTLRAVTSAGYARVYDYDIATYAKILIDKWGWRVPPARAVDSESPRNRLATAADVLSINNRPTGGPAIAVGDLIGPAGLYAGDRDMCIVLVNDNLGVDDGMGYALNAGLILWNSEVGAKRFNATSFKHRGVCGNHCFWDCEDLVQVRYRHVGDADKRIEAFLGGVAANGIEFRSLETDAKVMRWMQRESLGKDRDSVVDALYGMRMAPQSLTKKIIGQAFDMAEQFEGTDGVPSSWFGMMNGLTRLSQTFGNADRRMDLDMAAAELFNRAKKFAD